jgi:hypothetical protein
MRRREFLQTTAAGVAGALIGSDYLNAETGSNVLITDPVEGRILDHRHGRTVDGGLEITVRGKAPTGSPVTVNRIPAKQEGTDFTAKIVLREKQNRIVASCAKDGKKTETVARVLWDRYSFPRYRFAIDDNIFFARDIADKKYRSLFECPYLAMLKRFHQKYGTRFVLNMFYKTCYGADFNLSQFPDRYKSEWNANADWLKLAFHSNKEHPGYPYRETTYKRLADDVDQVAEQVIRFAGEATYTPPTVTHFAMVDPIAWQALADRGSKVLSGYFQKDKTGKYNINYCVDQARSALVDQYDALVDFKTGLIFSKVDIVINTVPPEKIVSTLEKSIENPNRTEIIDLLTHEQYFWPFYKVYQPDTAERFETAIRWVSENGYRPVHFQEGLLGATRPKKS